MGNSDDLYVALTRYVRTPEGVRKYGQPINTPIKPGGSDVFKKAVGAIRKAGSGKASSLNDPKGKAIHDEMEADFKKRGAEYQAKQAKKADLEAIGKYRSMGFIEQEEVDAYEAKYGKIPTKSLSTAAINQYRAMGFMEQEEVDQYETVYGKIPVSEDTPKAEKNDTKKDTVSKKSTEGSFPGGQKARVVTARDDIEDSSNSIRSYEFMPSAKLDGGAYFDVISEVNGEVFIKGRGGQIGRLIQTGQKPDSEGMVRVKVQWGQDKGGLDSSLHFGPEKQDAGKVSSQVFGIKPLSSTSSVPSHRQGKNRLAKADDSFKMEELSLDAPKVPRHKNLTSPQAKAFVAFDGEDGWVDEKALKKKGINIASYGNLVHQGLMESRPSGSYSTASYELRITEKGKKVLPAYSKKSDSDVSSKVATKAVEKAAGSASLKMTGQVLDSSGKQIALLLNGTPENKWEFKLLGYPKIFKVDTSSVPIKQAKAFALKALTEELARRKAISKKLAAGETIGTDTPKNRG